MLAIPFLFLVGVALGALSMGVGICMGLSDNYGSLKLAKVPRRQVELRTEIVKYYGQLFIVLAVVIACGYGMSFLFTHLK